MKRRRAKKEEEEQQRARELGIMSTLQPEGEGKNV
jgi:hypothetical protein